MDYHKTCNSAKLMWQECKRDYQIKSKYAIIIHHVRHIADCRYISVRIKCLNNTVMYQISLNFFIESRAVIKLHNPKHLNYRKEYITINSSDLCIFGNFQIVKRGIFLGNYDYLICNHSLLFGKDIFPSLNTHTHTHTDINFLMFKLV